MIVIITKTDLFSVLYVNVSKSVIIYIFHLLQNLLLLILTVGFDFLAYMNTLLISHPLVIHNSLKDSDRETASPVWLDYDMS